VSCFRCTMIVSTQPGTRTCQDFRFSATTRRRSKTAGYNSSSWHVPLLGCIRDGRKDSWFAGASKKQKHTTGGIPRWSPTLVLVARFSAYVWQSGRDAQFSLTYGRMCLLVWLFGLCSEIAWTVTTSTRGCWYRHVVHHS
jgi:hypothetical protein